MIHCLIFSTHGFLRSASLQRGEDFPVASKGRSVKDAVPGQEDGNGKGEGRENVTKRRRKEVKAVQSSTACGGCWQWCPAGTSQCTKFRLARRRESRGGQRMAAVLFPPHSGCRAFVLDGTKRIQDCRSSRSYRSEGRHEGQYPRVATEQHKIANQVGLALVPR